MGVRGARGNISAEWLTAVTFGLLGALVGMGLAAAFNFAAGKTVIEMIGTIFGAAAPVAGAVWLANRTERSSTRKRRRALVEAIVVVHQRAQSLSRLIDTGLSRNREDPHPDFMAAITPLETAKKDLEHFRALVDPTDYDVVVTMLRADEAYAALEAHFVTLRTATTFADPEFGRKALASGQAAVENLMDHTGAAATDLLTMDFGDRVLVGLRKRERFQR
ncbi:hypothetical protein IM816_05650 [Luteibacter flocculans]|uniref:5-bromo-4-chloroindolyl phosphate hydrolysis protein n=1 Tax=Luteibacter flocculans TaxID=2780091 RepID=A0ABY4T8B8_9GAMM|nr:hypothetical protein [Luteibacter flocculans]URL59580.1 hypothetical protein IM816_05650 [Luteibacter flocculans]